MKISVSALLALSLAASVRADVYMHVPRGSNGRNCETAQDRENANRLFDTQNNAAGGYACPKAMPFACYKKDGQAKNDCNALNTQTPNKGMVNSQAPHNLNINSADYTPTPRMYYVEGSILSIEWTNQHACGANDKTHCDVVLQAACEDTLTDDCGLGRTGNAAWTPRGTPVNNNKGDNVNGRATATIPDDANAQDDYRYGRHETFQYYQACKNRQRNKGLWIADQNVNGNDARYTRQNPGATRYGLECPEESEYYPYWHPTPWKDVGVVVSSLSRCALYETESQNVKNKGYCECTSGNCQGNGNLPNNPQACANKDGVWKEQQAWGLPPPRCEVGPLSRDNHLGNVAGDGQAYTFNWTIPSWMAGKKSCTLRLRYNISGLESSNHSGTFLDSSSNGDNSPVQDRNNNEIKSYKNVLNGRLGFATNTNQHGRTFQDRSYMFEVKPRNSATAGNCKSSGEIYNLNVRGKRGNIVQVYPSVEYDFAPNTLVVKENDCVHVQWTGSDYNPNRNPNNGEGGPPDPQNDGQARADRSNIVQMSSATNNYPEFESEKYGMFDATPQEWSRLAFLDQPYQNSDICATPNGLQNLANNRQARERHYKNCMKLNGADTPYFNGGVMTPEEGATST